MKNKIPAFLLEKAAVPLTVGHARLPRSVRDRSVGKIGTVIKTTMLQWESASRKGLLQTADARVKIVSLLFLLAIASVKKTIMPEIVLSFFLLALVILSGLSLARFYRRICLLAFLFGFLVVFPAAFNIITPGSQLFSVVTFREPQSFWIYTIPQSIGITREGLTVVGLMTFRVINSLSACFLLLYTTPLPEIMRGLKVFRVPDALLIILVLTYKYIFIFSTVLEEVYLAKKSRLLGPEKEWGTGSWTADRITFFFRKTQLKCEDVFSAMVSRGVTKEMKLNGTGALTTRDAFLGIGLCIVGLLILWM